MMFLQRKLDIVHPQWITGIGVFLLLIQLGFMGGWASPTLAILAGPDSPIPLTSEQTSWVASLVNIGRLGGAILGSALTDRLGSKRTIFITLFPIAIGWSIFTFADTVNWLYIARISSGFGVGMSFSSFPIYIGEVSMPEIRGALIALAACGGPFGTVIGTICSSYLSISLAASIYLSVCLLLMGLFFWLPESPHYLIKSNDSEAARKSIDWYRSGRGVDAEFHAVEKFIASNANMTIMDKLREFRSPSIRKATINIIALYTFMQICGLNSVIFYMEMIVTSAKSTLVVPSDLVIYVNIFGIFSSALSIFMIDRCGRKLLLLVSSCGVTLSMLGLMVHFMLKDSNVDLSNFQWLPPSSMVLFIVAFSFGLFPVPNAILSETFPANIKCIAACISSLTGGIMSFLSARTYLPLVDYIGETYVFLIYAICSVIVIPYTLFALTETKGKSLQQIQDELIKK